MTGSTHGIGRAYAQELASAGFDILIISLSQQDCLRVAQDLGIHSTVSVCTEREPAVLLTLLSHEAAVLVKRNLVLAFRRIMPKICIMPKIVKTKL